MSKIYNKKPLTYEEQLQHIEDRGLKILNRENALQTLQHISYYRLSGYWHHLYKKNQSGAYINEFAPSASFEEAVKLYEFDRQLRLFILDAIERIEVSLRNQIIYLLSHQYGSFGHSDDKNFHHKFNHANWLRELEQKETLRSKEEFICHFKLIYEGFPRLPIWMAAEIMSFGLLSKLFNGLKHEDKRSIAGMYHLHPKTLADWLHVLTYVRNMCAHHARLWNRKLAIKPNLHGLKNIQAQAPWLKNSRVPVVFVMINQLLVANQNGEDWRNNIEKLFKSTDHDEFIYRDMELPKEWLAKNFWLITASS